MANPQQRGNFPQNGNRPPYQPPAPLTVGQVQPDAGADVADLPLRKMQGNNLYMDVKDRLVWLRREAPDARITTTLVYHDPTGQQVIFKARVELANGAVGEGYGSETGGDFRDYIEKGETKAIGRALIALGYGAQFAGKRDGYDLEDAREAAGLYPGDSAGVDAAYLAAPRPTPSVPEQERPATAAPPMTPAEATAILDNAITLSEQSPAAARVLGGNLAAIAERDPGGTAADDPKTIVAEAIETSREIVAAAEALRDQIAETAGRSTTYVSVTQVRDGEVVVEASTPVPAERPAERPAATAPATPATPAASWSRSQAAAAKSAGRRGKSVPAAAPAPAEVLDVLTVTIPADIQGLTPETVKELVIAEGGKLGAERVKPLIHSFSTDEREVRVTSHLQPDELRRVLTVIRLLAAQPKAA